MFEFYWDESALVATFIPKTFKREHWKAVAANDNATASDAKKVAALVRALGFKVTGIAAMAGVPGVSDFILPLEIVEKEVGDEPMNYHIRTESPMAAAQVSSVAGIINHIILQAGSGSSRNKIHRLIDQLMGEETGDGRNAAGQLTPEQKDMMIPGVSGSVELFAGKLISSLL